MVHDCSVDARDEQKQTDQINLNSKAADDESILCRNRQLTKLSGTAPIYVMRLYCA